MLGQGSKDVCVRVITERRRHEQRKQAQNREVGQLLHGAAAAATLQV